MALREQISASEAALDLIGEGDWTPQDLQHARLLREAKSVVERLERAEAAITEQHSKLWLVGLDTHDGEEAQSREESHRNLDKLLDAVVVPVEKQPHE